MRRSRAPLLLVLPVAAALAAASSSARADEAATPSLSKAAPPKAAGLPSIGILADAGLPDGFGGSLVYRPWRWLRVQAGGTYNMISSGLRGGISLVPFGWGPSLSVEAGHTFEGDANGLARRFAGASYEDNVVLQRVAYDYANAHVGLDFGVRRVTFYLHGGLSYFRTTVRNTNDALQDAIGESSDPTADGSTVVTVNGDPKIRAIAPSFKLGFIVYLW